MRSAKLLFKFLTASLFTVLSFAFSLATIAQVDSVAIAGDSVAILEDTVAANSKPIVYVFEIQEDIMPPAWRVVKQAMNEASEMKADYIFLKLNTYGGMVNIADSISSRMLNAKVPTMVYIMQNAASAGALISISCDSIYMAPTARIGAATVVSGTGEAAPDKYQSYMRSTMRSAAAANGRNERIAEAMVDQSIEIPGVTEKDKILTFTTAEAIENGFCEREVNGFDEALTAAGFDDAKIIEYKISSVDRVIRFLTLPAVSGILMMVIFFGIYTELQSPGIGFSLLAAAIAATLYFAPHYLDGLAQNWEILLFLGGLVLIALELFVIPGFGVAGISGFVLVLGGLILSMVGNVGFDFRFAPIGDIGTATLVVTSALVASIFLISIFLQNVQSTGAFKRMVLDTTQQADSGYTINAFEEESNLVGSVGIAASDLRPSGKVEIEDERYDASTEGGFISRGDPIYVVSVMSNYLLVRENKENKG